MYEYEVFTLTGDLITKLNELGKSGWIVIQPIDTKGGQGLLQQHKVICIRDTES